jgi:hypothetical protein
MCENLFFIFKFSIIFFAINHQLVCIDDESFLLDISNGFLKLVFVFDVKQTINAIKRMSISHTPSLMLKSPYLI